MKYIIFLLSFGVYSSTCNVSDTAETTIYLVRHAEKAKDGTRDPNLTEKGKERALALAERLKDEKLTAVYSSNYKRTRQTAQPTASQQGVETTIYDPRSLDKLKANILKKYPEGGTFLIVGHSNTTPNLANLLIGSEMFSAIDESDYDNFYKVELSAKGKNKAICENCE